jgi:hypothetical protein
LYVGKVAMFKHGLIVRHQWILILILLLASSSSQAVPSMIAQVAQENSVPAELFYALILAETQSHTPQGRKAWPWTINHKGKPHFFQTKEDAYRYGERLLSQGSSNFDIGIAQINWKWHRKKFNDSLWDALDPYTNLSVAARHLRKQYERPECAQWDLAVGCYHRPARGQRDLMIANNYMNRVINIWFEL